MIPADTKERILDAARIEEVVGEFVSLKRRGASFVACCPFHNEKTPSFYVTPSKGIYKCFGCGKAGNAITFLKEHEGMSSDEAYRWLGKRYGIEVAEREESPEEIASRQRSESLYLVSEWAWKFYKEALKSGEGRSVGYAYFRSRGLEDSTIEKYGLGWAPKSRHALSDAALSAGYKAEYLVDAGLCLRNEDGSLVDRFFDRVMFPIHSVAGRVIAFGGRTLKSGHPAMKYVNTPTTDIYVKEKSLYGISFAKSEISRQKKCYLVEGYLDVLSMHQLGITNTVASSGTSLTTQQVMLIKRFAENVTIMYDGDSAGIHAALRGIGLVIKEGLNVKIVLLPDGDDPDSYSRKHSLQEVQEYIEHNEKDFISFKTEMLLSEAGDDPLKRAELINDVADTIALIPDPVKRTTYAQSSADRFNVDPQILFTRIGNTRTKMLEEEHKEEERRKRREERQEETGGDIPGIDEVPAESAPKTLFESPLLAPSEKELLWFILNNGRDPLEFPDDSDYYDARSAKVADFIRDNLEADECSFQNSEYREIYDAYFEFYDLEPPLEQDEILHRLINGVDQDLGSKVLNFTIDKYRLSVKNFQDSMTNKSTRLVIFVPKAILVYKAKRLQLRNLVLTEQLRHETDPDKSLQLLEEIKTTAAYRKLFDERLGRIR